MLKQFIFTNNDGYYEEGYTDGSGVVRSCDSGLAIGDLVMESETIANGVDKVTDNSDVRSVIGYCIAKPTTTTAEILLAGEIDGLSGLTKGEKVYLSDSGKFSSTKPSSGYLHILGYAIETTKLDFDPINSKIKIFKELFATPMVMTQFDAGGSSLGYPSHTIGNMIFVADTTWNFEGRVFYYTYDEVADTVTQIQEINIPSDTNNDGFGNGIACNGSHLIIGANGYNSGKGRTYLYSFNGSTWVKIKEMGGSDSNANTGRWVGVNNNYMFYNDRVSNNIVVRVYDYVNSTVVQDIIVGVQGFSVDGNRLVVMHSNDKVNVYDYNGSSFVLSQTITLTGASFNSVQKEPIMLDGNTFIVSSLGTNEAFICKYDGSSWSVYDKIVAPSVNNDRFSYAVDISERYKICIITDSGYDTGSNSNVGAVYIAKDDDTQYNIVQTIEGNAVDNYDLGLSASISDNGFLITGAKKIAFIIK